MADIGAILDSTDTSEAGGLGPVPVNDVIPVRITDIELKPTAAGGKMIKLSLEVADGKFAGRKIWHNLNIAHPTSKKAAAIGVRDYNLIAEACGVSEKDRRDTNSLRALVFQARVTKHEASLDGKYQNEVLNDFERAVGDFPTAPADFDDESIPF